jgi:sulfotransferase
MLDPPIHFVSGLPRSGTTLLMNLLGQNSAHYVTPTSGLIHLMLAVQRKWTHLQEFRAQGLATAKPFVRGAIQGLVTGFFHEQLAAGKTVFDKSRGWVQHVELVERVLDRPVKVITLIRDIRAVAASWEKVYRRRGIEFAVPREKEGEEVSTVTSRTNKILSPLKVTGRSIARVRDALDRCPEKLLIVPYERLTVAPIETMAKIHEALHLPPFAYDPEHVAQVTHEDDNYLGADLHTIRSRVEASAEPWRGILPAKLADRIHKEYEDLDRLAAGPVVDGADL